MVNGRMFTRNTRGNWGVLFGWSSSGSRTFAVALVPLVMIIAVASFLCFEYFGSHRLERSGSTIFVKKGDDFQKALDAANSGDTILLQTGVTFKGSFTLPNKPGSDFITIRSSASSDQLPTENVRIDPVKLGTYLPKLESNIKGKPVLLAANGAHHFRFIGVEFGPTVEGLYNIIQIGTGEEANILDLPHHIEFDRVYIHGSPTEGQRRGIAANGKYIKIVNSYISDIKRKGEESQAIAAWATDGPIEIENNYLEAAGENILFGGATSSLELIPTDCVVRYNHLNKSLQWRKEDWVVKNLFEIKNGRRITVEFNLMTNNWPSAQDGSAVLFTTREDSGKHAVIDDIRFSSNIVRGSSNGLNIYGSEGNGGRKLLISNNIFDDINANKWGGNGFFMKSTAWNGLTIENNTIIQSGSITVAYGDPVRDFVFRNNIVFHNEYGIFGDGTGSGQVAIDKFFPGGTVAANIIIGGNRLSLREKNFFITSLDQLRFVDPSKGDYRLPNDNPFLHKGLGRKQIGADLDSAMVGAR